MGDARVDRRFTYDSVNTYYLWKTNKFPGETIPLEKDSFDSIESLVANFQSVAARLGVALSECGVEPYTWVKYIGEAADPNATWKFREYVFCSSMIFDGKYLATADKSLPVKIGEFSREIPSDFSIEEYMFTVIGSSELTSDIDVTIQGPSSSFLISVLEDLFITMNGMGIPIRCWDLEFYGDFKLLKSVYINFTKFSTYQKLLLLNYALISYFRSTQQSDPSAKPVLSPLAATIVRKFIDQLHLDKTISLGDTTQLAYDNWLRDAPGGKLNRETFYKSIKTVEDYSKVVEKYMKSANTKKISNNIELEKDPKLKTVENLKSLAFTFFIGIANGNIHRPESYILPSTAVHVVEFEQRKDGMFSDAIPESWFSTNARIGIDKSGFLLSALEQLGYLEHYHPNKGELCSKKGVKYFGRLLRALVQSKLLDKDSLIVGTSNRFNAFRSSSSTECPANIHTLLEDLNKQLNAQNKNTRKNNIVNALGRGANAVKGGVMKTRKHRR